MFFHGSRNVYKSLQVITFKKSLLETAVPLLYQRGYGNEPSTAYFTSPDFPLVYAAQCALEVIHTKTQLPWWATITGTTVVLRSTITLPLAIHQNKMIAKMELLQPTLKEISAALKNNLAVKFRRQGRSAEEFNKTYKKEYAMIRQDLFKREGCSPIKMVILPWMQLPLWIFLSLALRNMTGAYVRQWTSENALCPDMESGGILWFCNLIQPDTTLILPICVGLFNLTNIEIHALKWKQGTKPQRVITNTLRCLSVGMVFVSSQVPSAMTLYWAFSAAFGLAQNVALKFPAVRRTFGIPVTRSESKMPLRDLATIISTRTKEFLKLQREEPWKRK